MGELIQLHAWPIHVGSKEDEFVTLCGESGDGVLMLDTHKAGQKLLAGYKLCEACRAEQKRLSESSG